LEKLKNFLPQQYKRALLDSEVGGILNDKYMVIHQKE
jgi:hypothetical protein